MKSLVSILLVACLVAACLWNFSPREHTPQTPFIDLPEEISEAKSGTLLYVESATPDTIHIEFDNMDDLISLWRNDSNDSVWVDLQTMVIYNAARHEEKQFINSKDLADELRLELNR